MDRRLTKSCYLLLCSSILVIAAYYYLDKPIVFWAYQHQLRQHHWLDWFTKIPEFLTITLFFVYPYLVIRYYSTKFRYIDYVLLIFANSIAISDLLHNFLKFIFGRYWPETWKDNNLSLIHDNAYGFNWFHDGVTFKSFPSGHASSIMCFATVLWITYPKLRWLASLLVALVVIGLIGMYYHFFSDIIAGATLGYLTAYHTAIISRLDQRAANVTNNI